jgi:hypothetical protein
MPERLEISSSEHLNEVGNIGFLNLLYRTFSETATASYLIIIDLQGGDRM